MPLLSLNYLACNIDELVEYVLCLPACCTLVPKVSFPALTCLVSLVPWDGLTQGSSRTLRMKKGFRAVPLSCIKISAQERLDHDEIGAPKGCKENKAKSKDLRPSQLGMDRWPSQLLAEQSN